MTDSFNLNRSQRLSIMQEQTDWDIVIIGGGITGAGILKLASQLGLKALLLEQNDFSWGSSSRSSKMVHGGLRYIADGQIKLTIESVRERQHLVEHSNGLVFNQSFLMSHYHKEFPQPWIFNGLLSVYDYIAGIKQHSYHPKQDYFYFAPKVKSIHSKGGSQFVDAMTDDCRLVLRLLQEAQTNNNDILAINYTKVIKLNYNRQNIKSVIVQVNDQAEPITINSKVVINATGALANQFNKYNQKVKLRALRGSHLIVSNLSLPVASAISVRHPKDKRPVQIYPWQNATVIGTTDVEHHKDLNIEPNISQDEFDYLLQCVKHQFENIKLTELDLISTFSGVRPVVTKGGVITPSKEKRDHSIWHEYGLINIAGGKLTTFRVIAKHVLEIACKLLNKDVDTYMFTAFDENFRINKNNLSKHIINRLAGNYGQLTNQLLIESNQSDMKPISYSLTLWSEIIWSIKHEQVMHLDDLLLRRTRIGNVLPNGAIEQLDKIKPWCIKYLNWDESKWHDELNRYLNIWNTHYSFKHLTKKYEGKLNE
ncbi:hypothetical protein CJF42_05360 [Pseudoalteromonas sp. NBT06-2]|uniref:glycerol-3-phosphate dehydrogenase/oxidase n=1 Tax=Pseudoalteromonas sp. NBT06-2 TaxID=2025950 RepID=UPI000BA5A569|nr:glycerol-3-phosphate dehydrogenase/oxidase [Pseudoalteromonas sp. NBT06-2]PAJ75399.1 hypothetical protein CJF42_05360 [Pseudoalteromonas sp. NBT06-2]